MWQLASYADDGEKLLNSLTLKVCRSEIHAGDDRAYNHIEFISIPANSTLLDAIDHIRNTYSFNGVSFTSPAHIWIVSGHTFSGLRVPLALTGMEYTATDVFDTSLTFEDLDLTKPLYFKNNFPNNLHPHRIIQQRYKEGSKIASEFYKLRRAKGYLDDFP